MTRVSEYMVEIVEYIQTIMSNNMAYESNGSVHFDTQAFRYTHTRHQHASDCAAGKPCQPPLFCFHICYWDIQACYALISGHSGECAGKVGMCMAN